MKGEPPIDPPDDDEDDEDTFDVDDFDPPDTYDELRANDMADRAQAFEERVRWERY